MRAARKAQAAQFAADVLLIIREVQAAGHTSFNAIAGQLNARKVATANGGQWRHAQARQILGRASASAARRDTKNKGVRLINGSSRCRCLSNCAKGAANATP